MKTPFAVRILDDILFTLVLTAPLLPLLAQWLPATAALTA
jgi:hypothetical protein